MKAGAAQARLDAAQLSIFSAVAVSAALQAGTVVLPRRHCEILQNQGVSDSRRSATGAVIQEAFDKPKNVEFKGEAARGHAHASMLDLLPDSSMNASCRQG